jgi:hypothetical protein
MAAGAKNYAVAWQNAASSLLPQARFVESGARQLGVLQVAAKQVFEAPHIDVI